MVVMSVILITTSIGFKFTEFFLIQMLTLPIVSGTSIVLFTKEMLTTSGGLRIAIIMTIQLPTIIVYNYNIGSALITKLNEIGEWGWQSKIQQDNFIILKGNIVIVNRKMNLICSTTIVSIHN